ncbi:MAG: hypothetical protein A3K61_01595 [Thaumarchaeota archaeon RBG_16_49_8]|nr:MAG: hypothetical protein A3K61_01595 [Thaumarchaeota archaeon RBG_16_49_8]
MEEKQQQPSVSFKVSFKPTCNWADKTYLGNMLTELLGLVAKKTTAFEFEIETFPEENGSKQ